MTNTITVDDVISLWQSGLIDRREARNILAALGVIPRDQKVQAA